MNKDILHSTRPSVGHIQFLNCLPIYYGLVRNSGILDLDMEKGVPSELNRKLVDGTLDISPISSIEYARHADELLLLPSPTVSCRGPVKSILLVSTLPLHGLDRRSVALTAVSATSQVLVKILLRKRYGIEPEYTVSSAPLEEALAEHDAVLLIGDSALEHLAPPEGTTAYDLGREWEDFTDAGMVFAVWAVRRDFFRRHPDLTRHVWQLFQDSLSFCYGNLAEIAADAARWEPFSSPFIEEYFRTLTFGFDDELRRGLELFFRYAAETGELDRVPTLDFAFSPETENVT